MSLVSCTQHVPKNYKVRVFINICDDDNTAIVIHSDTEGESLLPSR